MVKLTFSRNRTADTFGVSKYSTLPHVSRTSRAWYVPRLTPTNFERRATNYSTFSATLFTATASRSVSRANSSFTTVSSREQFSKSRVLSVQRYKIYLLHAYRFQLEFVYQLRPLKLKKQPLGEWRFSTYMPQIKYETAWI